MQIPAFPSFRIRPAAGAAGERDVTGPDGQTVARLTRTTGWTAHRGQTAGPRRADETRAAADAVILHAHRHGLPDTELRPYTSAQDAQQDLARTTGLYQDLVEAASRAYFFAALRQPKVAALLDGLETLRSERHFDTAAGCNRTARFLHDLHRPARALLATATGEALEWMSYPLTELLVHSERAAVRLTATAAELPRFLTGPFTHPHSAYDAVEALHRARLELRTTAKTLPRGPKALRTALTRIEEASGALPQRGAARSAHSCRTTAAQLTAIGSAAGTALGTPVLSLPANQPVAAPCRDIAALAHETAHRLAATAAVLNDVPRHGSVRNITDAAARTETTPARPGEPVSVRFENREIGPINPTPEGRWTADGITEPYHSPEGAIAALVAALT
ncbi:hypothetical protein [Streptomyces sp. NPDC001889]